MIYENAMQYSTIQYKRNRDFVGIFYIVYYWKTNFRLNATMSKEQSSVFRAGFRFSACD